MSGSDTSSEPDSVEDLLDAYADVDQLTNHPATDNQPTTQPTALSTLNPNIAPFHPSSPSTFDDENIEIEDLGEDLDEDLNKNENTKKS